MAAAKKPAKAVKKAPPKAKEKEIVSKTALIDKVAAEVEGITKKDITSVVNALLPIIVKTVEQGDEVRLIGFGTFKQAHRSARTGRNPQTGEEIKIAASDSFAFKSNIKFG